MKALLSSTVLALALALTASVSAAAPPSKLFVHGYNLCRTTSLETMTTVAKRHFVTARFDGATCTWSTGDGNATILIDVHPSSYLDYLAPPVGRHANGDVVRRIKVPGATKGLLETFSHANTARYAKDLFAAYPGGVVQVSVNYATPVSDALVVAVMRLVTHT